MENQLRVSLENIIPLTYARDHFSQIVAEVQKDKLFVLTKGGKPAVAIIDVRYLESVTGGQIQKADIKEEIKKSPEKVGLPPMIEHPPTLQSDSGRASSGAVPTKPTSPPPAPQPKADQPRVEKPIAPPPPPFKPAGFAAPQPSKPSQEKPIPKAPPPTQEATEPKPTGPIETKPTGKLVMPEEPPKKTTAMPNEPLTTLPPVGQKTGGSDQVNVEFAPDQDVTDKKSAEDRTPDAKKTAPDDKNPPAQYAGEEEKDAEPEDMPLD